MKIYQEAVKRGEVINFGDNKDAAIEFGKGSWKKKMQDGGGGREREVPQKEEDEEIDEDEEELPPVERCVIS